MTINNTNINKNKLSTKENNPTLITAQDQTNFIKITQLLAKEKQLLTEEVALLIQENQLNKKIRKLLRKTEDESQLQKLEIELLK